MNKKVTGHSVRDYNDSDLMVDEDIELDEDVKIEDKIITSRKSVNDSIVPRFSKATIAGILLIFVFILNLFLPITFIYMINEIENATGVTDLRGQVLDEDDAPVANVTVSVVGTNRTTYTDIDGKYSLNNVPVGENEIKFAKMGYRQILVRKFLFSKDLLGQTQEDTNIIDVPGVLQSGIYINALEGPFIKTKIVDDKLNSTISGSVVNSAGTPLPDIQVRISNTNLSTQTNNDGQYELNGVSPGIITIEAISALNRITTEVTILFASNESMEVNIVYYENKNITIDRVIGKSESINGSVIDIDKQPIVNAILILDINESIYPNNTIKSDENGAFIFNNVPLGLYQIKIQAHDYSIVNVINITVNNGSNTTLAEIELNKLESPLKVEEQISSMYTLICVLLLLLFPIITLAGGISAIQKKRYGLAFIGAIVGMFPLILVLQTYVCSAGVFSIISLVLLVFSRSEFSFRTRN